MRCTLILIVTSFLFLACSKKEIQDEPISQVIEESSKRNFQEPFRPQFHFSPPEKWMNDPNGMFYYQGKYHLFYQFNPDSTVWGPMHWGHAVSKDLTSWEHLPIALYPDSLGFIFSGSAVVDVNNTSGFGSIENPPIVAIYTYDNPDSSDPAFRQTQGIAYSLDAGNTFVPYQKNPVLNRVERDFRDPKVFWYEPESKWVMALAVADHIEFYSSPNLKDWEFLSEFGDQDGYHEGVWECPDLVQLPIQGSNEKKWVLIVSVGNEGEIGSATQYFVGDFDGIRFTNNHYPERILWVDHGRDNYAGVTWSGVPEADGRKIFLGWMSNWDYANVVPTEGWRSHMTIPRTLVLFSTPDGLRLNSYPVEESKLLRSRSLRQNRTIINVEMDWTHFLDSGNHRLDMEFIVTKIVSSGAWEIVLSNDVDEQLSFGYDDRSQVVYVDRTKAGLSDFSDKFAGRHEAPRLSRSDAMGVRVLIDETSIEVFADVGQVVLSDLFFATRPFNKMKFRTPYDEVLFEGEFFHLKSIW